jgi:hypothetical protein
VAAAVAVAAQLERDHRLQIALQFVDRSVLPIGALENLRAGWWHRATNTCGCKVEMTVRYARLAPDAFSSDYGRFAPVRLLDAV